MANIKTVEYLCPHCGKKLPTFPSGKSVSMGVKRGIFGRALVNCKGCKKPYLQSFVNEAALFLTEAEPVPLMWYGPRVLFVLGLCECVILTPFILLEEILPLILAVFISGLGMLLLIAVFGLITRAYRYKMKNAILRESRERMLNDDAYLLSLINTANLPAAKDYLRACFEADRVPHLNESDPASRKGL